MQDSFSRLDVDSKEYDEALMSALSIAMSQWFRRTWVVQEFCWAQDVIFAIGEATLTLEAIVLSFKMIQALPIFNNLPEAIDKDQSRAEFPNPFIKYSSIWVPQVQYGTYAGRIRFHATMSGVSC